MVAFTAACVLDSDGHSGNLGGTLNGLSGMTALYCCAEHRHAPRLCLGTFISIRLSKDSGFMHSFVLNLARSRALNFPHVLVHPEMPLQHWTCRMTSIRKSLLTEATFLIQPVSPTPTSCFISSISRLHFRINHLFVVFFLTSHSFLPTPTYTFQFY